MKKIILGGIVVGKFSKYSTVYDKGKPTNEKEEKKYIQLLSQRHYGQNNENMRAELYEIKVTDQTFSRSLGNQSIEINCEEYEFDNRTGYYEPAPTPVPTPAHSNGGVESNSTFNQTQV